ncbi:nicotinamide riboside kinase 1 isoform X1 [Danio rerio]|uniref:Nicotinamide riboside kinase 1 isoform X1 n=1 Tax=Danio rerio TaxID=7955 RepID=A0AC58IQL8_DANRE
MRKVIVGIGGMTNGGKTTLSKSLQELLPNSCVISQDNFFKDDSEVPADIRGFKEYDSLLMLCSTRSTSCRFLMRRAKREEAPESMCLQIRQATLIATFGPCT